MFWCIVRNMTTKRQTTDALGDTADYRVGGPLDSTEPVIISMDRARGQAYFIPRSLRNAGPAGQEAASALGSAVREIEEARQRIADAVVVARAEGLSWDSIGWCLGITGTAVRRRFGDE